MTEDWIPIVALAVTGLVAVSWLYLRHRGQVETQHTFRLALEKGAELSPDLIRQLAAPEPSRDRDLRRGLVWMALAIGLSLCGLAVPDPDALRGCLAGAAFPFSIGVAYLIMYVYGTRKSS